MFIYLKYYNSFVLFDFAVLFWVIFDFDSLGVNFFSHELKRHFHICTFPANRPHAIMILISTRANRSLMISQEMMTVSLHMWLRLKSHNFSYSLTSFIERPAWAFLFSTMALRLFLFISLLKTGTKYNLFTMIKKTFD